MPIMLLLGGPTAPLFLLLSPLSVASMAARDCVPWKPVAKAVPTDPRTADPCTKPRYILM